MLQILHHPSPYELGLILSSLFPAQSNDNSVQLQRKEIAYNTKNHPIQATKNLMLAPNIPLLIAFRPILKKALYSLVVYLITLKAQSERVNILLLYAFFPCFHDLLNLITQKYSQSPV